MSPLEAEWEDGFHRISPPDVGERKVASTRNVVGVMPSLRAKQLKLKENSMPPARSTGRCASPPRRLAKQAVSMPELAYEAQNARSKSHILDNPRRPSPSRSASASRRRGASQGASGRGACGTRASCTPRRTPLKQRNAHCRSLSRTPPRTPLKERPQSPQFLVQTRSDATRHCIRSLGYHRAVAKQSVGAESRSSSFHHYMIEKLVEIDCLRSVGLHSSVDAWVSARRNCLANV